MDTCKKRERENRYPYNHENRRKGTRGNGERKKKIEVAQQLVQTRNSARGESDDRFVFRYVILYESGYNRFKRGKNKVCCRLIPKVICLLTNAGQTYRNLDIPKTF